MSSQEIDTEAIEKEYTGRARSVATVAGVAIGLAILFFILTLVFAGVSIKKKKDTKGPVEPK